VKKICKILLIIMILSIGIIAIVNLPKNTQTEVYAANAGSTSNVQLIARAINGEARGEPYEGSSWCSNIK